MTPALHVLVLEDEERPRALLEELVASRGHTFVSAACLEEGERLLKRGRYELVITDLCIPLRAGGFPRAEHGYEFERKVRAALPREQTYLIVLTGQGLSAMDSSLAHDHGCDAYVLKGDRERLLNKLEEAEARAAGRTTPRPAGPLPLRAKVWSDCTLLLGEPLLARTASGAEAPVEASRATLNALYQLCWARPEEGSDLLGAGNSAARVRTLARDVRKLLCATFAVEEGGDPLPRRRARKTWVCRVRLRERDVEVEDYADLRRREHFDPEDL